MRLPLRILSLLFIGSCLNVLHAQIPAHGPVVVVVEENRSYESVIGSSSAPFINSLANQYVLLTNYYANTHPSIGNYFMMTTGRIITNNDGYTGTVTQDNLARRLITAGKTWKSYAESLPSVGYIGGNTGWYAKRHNPFAYFSDVRNSAVQRQQLVPFTQFSKDLANNALPDFSFIVPNLKNDAHDGSLAAADAWLKTNLQPLLNSAQFRKDGLLIIAFDESYDADKVHGGGHIAVVVAGPKTKKGYKSKVFYQQESLLKTVLKSLGITTYIGASGSTSSFYDAF